MKYKVYIQSLIEIEVEADTIGEAQRIVFRALDEGNYDYSLRDKALVDIENRRNKNEQED